MDENELHANSPVSAISNSPKHNAYFSTPDDPCTLELSSTINTVLPTLRRSAPSFTAQSRHFSNSDNDTTNELLKSRDDNSLREFIRCTSAQSSTSSASPNQPASFAISIPSSRSVGSGTSTTLSIQKPALPQKEEISAFIVNEKQDHLKFENRKFGLRASSKSISVSSTSTSEPFENRAKARSFYIRKRPVTSHHSVSSSVDSTNEDKFAANLQHCQNIATNSAVLVLPKLPIRPTTMSANCETEMSQISHSPSMVSIHSASSFYVKEIHESDELPYSSKHKNRTSSEERTCYSRSSDFAEDNTYLRLENSPSTDLSVTEMCPDAFSARSNKITSEWERGVWHSTSDLSINDDENFVSSDTIRQSTSTMKHGDLRQKRPLSQCGIHRKSQYLGELVWQVDEMVFCGGIEAAQNQNLLCRLNIEYIVDISGQDDDPDLKNRPRNECPCLCSKRTAHSRMTMSINVRDYSESALRPASSFDPALASNTTSNVVSDSKRSDREREQIVESFQALTELIRKARISQKKVLIHSLKGRNRAPAFVAAYLMQCNRSTRVQALARISQMMSKMRPGMCISDELQRALMRWQSILCIRSEETHIDSNSITKMFAVKRNAWS